MPTLQGLVTKWLLWESTLLGNSKEGSYLWSIDAPLGRGGRMTPFPVGNYCPGALRGHPIMPILIPLHHHLAATIILVPASVEASSSICVWSRGHQSARETTILCLKPSSISNLHESCQNLP